MAGAAEQLAERRERKKVAADKFATAQRDMIKRIFEEIHLPRMTRVLTGVCTEISTTRKTIKVRLDPLAADLRMPELDISWDRPNLSEPEVVDKTVKVFVMYSSGRPQAMLAAITSE